MLRIPHRPHRYSLLAHRTPIQTIPGIQAQTGSNSSLSKGVGPKLRGSSVLKLKSKNVVPADFLNGSKHFKFHIATWFWHLNGLRSSKQMLGSTGQGVPMAQRQRWLPGQQPRLWLPIDHTIPYQTIFYHTIPYHTIQYTIPRCTALHRSKPDYTRHPSAHWVE